jgi:hypothetical protein
VVHLRRLEFTAAVCLLVAGAAWGQATDLEECLGPGGTYCSASGWSIADTSCGQTFYWYTGRITWPVLRNVGPITLSVTTRAFPNRTVYPLYVEMVRVRVDPGNCRTAGGGYLLLAAQGADQCGGTTESVGPIDLTHLGIPLWTLYAVQIVFFRDLVNDRYRSVAMSCVRLTARPVGVAGSTWSAAKALYR